MLPFLQDVHLEFVLAAANLKAEIYGIKQVRDKAAIKAMVDEVTVPEFKPKSGIKISVTDADLEANSSNGNFGKFYMNYWIITEELLCNFEGLNPRNVLQISAI